MKRQKIRVLANLLTELSGSTLQVLPEHFIEITGIVKADLKGQVGNGSGRRVIILDQESCHINAVFHQIFDRSHMQAALDTATALTFADVYLGCKIIQCDAVGIMGFNIFHNFLGTDFVGSKNCRILGFTWGERKLFQQFVPKFADAGFGCQFIAPFN